MGKPLDFLQSALKALSGPDEIVKWGSVLKCTGYGGWLVLDMLQWVCQERVPLIITNHLLSSLCCL